MIDNQEGTVPTTVETVCRLTGAEVPNVDSATGTHYGVICSNDLHPEAVNDITMNGDDLAYEELRLDMAEKITACATTVLTDEVMISDDPPPVVEHMVGRRLSALPEQNRTNPLFIQVILEDVLSRLMNVPNEELAAEMRGEMQGPCEDWMSCRVNEWLDRNFNPATLAESLSHRCAELALSIATAPTPAEALTLTGQLLQKAREGLATFTKETADDLVSVMMEDIPGDNGGPWQWTDGDLTVRLDTDNDVWVLHSPVYTKCHECSPCAPNAGHLNDRGKTGRPWLRTFCLDKEWFEDDKCPYPYWSVETRELMYHPKGVVECKFCHKNERADKARVHDRGHVCRTCWDERLRTTE